MASALSLRVKETIKVADNGPKARRFKMPVPLIMMVSDPKKSSQRKTAVSALLLILLALGLAPQAAVAATAGNSFGVSVMVEASCLASASSTMMRIDTVTPESAASSVSVQCSNSTPYNVSSSLGMASGTMVAAHEIPTPGSAFEKVAGTGRGSQPMFPVLGEIPRGQNVAAGVTADTMIIAVTY